MIIQKRNPLWSIGALIGALVGLFLGNMLLWMIVGAVIGHLIEKRFSLHKKSKVIDVKNPHKSVSFWVFLIFFLLLVYFFRPWFHEFFMLFYTHPSIVFALLFALISLFLFMKNKKKIAYTAVAIVIFCFIVASFNDLIVQRYIVSDTTYHLINELPDASKARIVPLAVAERYAKDSLQKSREKMGDFDFVNINNTLIWTSPRVPDGFILYFTQKVQGVMTVDAEKSSRNTKMITKQLEIGEDIGITDNIYWKLYKECYLMELGEIYYIIEDDDILTIAPVIKYKFKFPVMVPYFDGVYVVDSEGKIKKYSPSEIQNIEYLKNNRAYPENLARIYVESYQYHLGIFNAFFLHKDQIEIADVYGQHNRQPFLMPTEQGLKWIIAAEPYGESYGIFKIFLVDAVTGKIDMLEMDEDKTLTGPVMVVDYVRKHFPMIDWSRFTIIEPRPYVVNGKLYWMLSITPIDFAGISHTVFVDAETNNVFSFQTDDAVMQFVSTGKVIKEEKEQDKGPSTQDLINDIEEKLDELKKILGEE